VDAWLKIGGNNSNTFADLEGGDTLEVTVDGETKTLEGRSGHRYTASFTSDEAATEFTFAFLRDEDDDAPESTVLLPAPFEMEVTSADVVRGQDDVEFTWEPSGSGDMQVHVDGDCVFFENQATPDDGEHSVAPEDLEGPGDDDGEQCTGTVQLTRSRSGSIDPAFTEGGEITARQERQGTFRSLPPTE
jgi:hypothetical protein